MEVEEVRDQTPREKKLRELRKIDYWLGERKEGEFIPESTATNVKRTYKCHGKSVSEKDENGNPKIVVVEKEEIVYMHGGYRPKFEGEKKTRAAFFFRGARVWRS